MSKPYIKILMSLLDKYIENKKLGFEIYAPLNDLLDEIEALSTETFKNMKESFLKGSKNENITNFLYFHSVRNLRLTTYKIIDSFKMAESRALNPVVARQLKAFIEPFYKFLFFLKILKQETFPKVELLSEELEKFRETAKQSNFLCSLHDELKYDKITHKEFRDLMNSMGEINIEEMH
ncbi:MAG: hypothetical protein ACTSQU_12040 [Promethearchaeota archaeon]